MSKDRRVSDLSSPAHVHVNVNLVVNDERSIGLQADHIDSVYSTTNVSPTQENKDVNAESPNHVNHQTHIDSQTENNSQSLDQPSSEATTDSRTTSTKADENGTTGENLKAGIVVKPRLDQVFNFIDQTTNLMANDENDKAFNIFKFRSILGPQLRDATFLVGYYACCLKTSHYEIANKLKTDITALITKHVDSTPESMKTFADDLNSKDQHFEAILFYEISSEQFALLENDKQLALGISSCVLGIRESCESLGAKTKKRYLHNIEHHVVGVMESMREVLATRCSEQDSFTLVRLAWCHLNISHVQGLTKDKKGEELSLKRALDLVAHNLGEEAAEQHKVYGMCLHNLGVIQYGASRLSQALENFSAATRAKKAATDYSTEYEKEVSVERSEKGIKMVKKRRRISGKGF